MECNRDGTMQNGCRKEQNMTGCSNCTCQWSWKGSMDGSGVESRI